MLDLFGKYYRNGAVVSDPVERFCDAVFRSDRFSEWHLDRQRVLARLRAITHRSYANLVDAVFCEYLASHDPRKRRWGDKNAPYVLGIPKIFKLFPHAKVIHVIRDGRDVAISYQDVPFGPKSAFGAALFWRRRVLAGRRYGRWAGPARYCEVKYEELVGHPEQVCRQVCDFLGETFSPEMLKYYEYNRRKGLVPKHRLAWHQYTLEPVTVSRVGRWKHGMSERDRMIFESLCGSAMEQFGYQTQRFRTPGNAWAALLWTGARWAVRGLWRRGWELLGGGMIVLLPRGL